MIIEQDFLALPPDWLAEHKNLKLCFVDEHDTRRGEDGYVSEYGYWLFFTDCPMSEQWGDDWDEQGQYVKAHEGQWLCEGYDGKWTVRDEPPGDFCAHRRK